MDINEWHTHEIERLKRFVDFYKDGQENTPDQFPSEMDIGEWDENYLAFDGGE